jgi:hypothetical protein
MNDETWHDETSLPELLEYLIEADKGGYAKDCQEIKDKIVRLIAFNSTYWYNLGHRDAATKKPELPAQEEPKSN